MNIIDILEKHNIAIDLLWKPRVTYYKSLNLHQKYEIWVMRQKKMTTSFGPR